MTGDRLSYRIEETSHGWIGVAATGRGVSRLTLPQRTERQAVESLGIKAVANGSPDDETLSPLTARMGSYYSGEVQEFDDVELDLSDRTPFQRQVLESVRSIPRGQVRSYAQVAASVGRPNAARAVGAAMASNPVCVIIPCHRVIGSDGSLAGFGGGLELKRRMLELEGMSVG